jgi:hypothetical protein
VGETRVDLQHLLEDLRDAYSGPIEESIVTEAVANALDAGATTIGVAVHPADSAITIVDDGRGMQRRELARYHDLAASSKRRGDGIGFAGVGIKLGLLVSRDVITEARRGKTHVATRWSLTSRHRAPWKWIPPPGLLAADGTAVRLTLANPLSTLLDSGFLEETIRRHFEPLLDPAFGEILRRHYSRPVSFAVDGRRLAAAGPRDAELAPVAVRLARKRLPSALGYLARTAAPMPPERTGLAVSTYGKVILRGWDWIGLSPANGDRVTGLIEVPDLAGSLTLNKNDFLRTGPRGATYLAYRKALQEVVSRQLAEWGETRGDAAPTPRPARLDRDLERVLEDLAADFPLLQSLVERRRGGQKPLPMPDGVADGEFGPLFALAAALEAANDPPASAANPETEPARPPLPAQAETEPEPPTPSRGPHRDTTLPGARATRRRAQYGLRVQFEERPDDHELGRLVESTIWVNQSHPAYAQAAASRSIGYHLALTVALALAPLAVPAAEEHGFVTRFLAEWGQVKDTGKRPARRRRRKRKTSTERTRAARRA